MCNHWWINLHLYRYMYLKIVIRYSRLQSVVSEVFEYMFRCKMYIQNELWISKN